MGYFHSDEQIYSTCPVCGKFPLDYSAEKCNRCGATINRMNGRRKEMEDENKQKWKVIKFFAGLIVIYIILAAINRPNTQSAISEIEGESNNTSYNVAGAAVIDEKNTITPITKESEHSTHFANKNKEEGRKAEIEKISGYTTKSSEHFDIVVVVVDDEFNSVNRVSSEVANVYRGNGNIVTNSYFTNSFLHSNYFADLETGSSEVINMLSLTDKVSHLVIGRYKVTFDNNASGVSGLKYVCNAELDVKVISCKKKVQIDGFHLPGKYPSDDKEGAERGAINSMISGLRNKTLNY